MLLEEMFLYWAQSSFSPSSTAPRQEFQNVIAKVLCFHDVISERL